MIAPRSARGASAWVARLRRPVRTRPRTLEEARALADPARVRRVLAIKLHDQLGDFLVATPALAALRARYPAASLTLLTRAYLAPLATRQAAPDRVLVLAGGNGPRILWAACVPRPDLVVVLNSVSRSRTADLFAAVSGTPLVVGRSRVGAGAPPADAPPLAAAGARVAADPVYDIDLPIAHGSQHQVDRLLDVVRWLGADAPAGATAPSLALRPEDRAGGRAVLEAAGPSRGGPCIGLHPAAANPLKCWPVERFATLGAHLARTKEARLFVLDTPKEPGPARALRAALGARGVPATLVPPQPLGTFAGACAELDLVACNDSGVMHVAAAVGAAVLSFHSLGDPAEWAPRVPGRARALHAERIERITAAEAVAAAIALLPGTR